MPPVHLSVNYEFEGIGRKRQYDYSRTANPTRDELAQALARAEGGAGGVVTSTGMSAILLLLHLVRPGELVVAPHDGYGGTFRLLSSYARERGLLVEFVDLNDVAARDAAFRRGPRIVWIETPSNPLLRIVDIRETARAAHAAGAEVVADNTFLSPALQQPLSLGADYVVHSTTKYINGHGDVVGGAVVACDAPATSDLHGGPIVLVFPARHSTVTSRCGDCGPSTRGWPSTNAMPCASRSSSSRTPAWAACTTPGSPRTRDTPWRKHNRKDSAEC
jgi:cystathionine gamma-synthase